MPSPWSSTYKLASLVSRGLAKGLGDPPLNDGTGASSVFQVLIGWEELVAAEFGLEPIGWVGAIDWLATELHNSCCEVLGGISIKHKFPY